MWFQASTVLSNPTILWFTPRFCVVLVKNLPWESPVVKTSVQYCCCRFLTLVCVLLENWGDHSSCPVWFRRLFKCQQLNYIPQRWFETRFLSDCLLRSFTDKYLNRDWIYEYFFQVSANTRMHIFTRKSTALHFRCDRSQSVDVSLELKLKLLCCITALKSSSIRSQCNQSY